MQQIIRLLAWLSAHLRLDLLWRIISRLSSCDRIYLLVRILQEAQVDRLTFRRGDTVWSAFAWDDQITTVMLEQGGFQKREIEALLSWLDGKGQFTPERQVIVDVGANIGTSSIPFAQLTRCRVIAIEPVPENFELLQQNVRQNGLEDHITCVPLAVSDVRTKVEMVLSAHRSGGPEIRQAGSAPSLTRSGGKDKGTIEVSADLLSDILASCGVSPEHVAFVWADVQGHEPYLMKSGEPLWLAGVPLYLEVDPLLLRTQRGLELLPHLSTQYFGSFIESNDLIRYGTAAPAHPIQSLADLLHRLARTDASTDVLLLPRAS